MAQCRQSGTLEQGAGQMKPTRSHGRQSIRATLQPRELMQDKPDYADVWQARIVTLFPDLFPGVLGASLTGKALRDQR